MSRKIGVFAGTPVDTDFGKDIFERAGFYVISFALAKSPSEQTDLQYYHKKELEQNIAKKSLEMQRSGVEKIVIYCNSLSSAVDYKSISKKTGIQILTPLEAYENLPKSVKSIALITANGISAYKIDSVIRNSRSDIHTVTYSNLGLVEQIERRLEPRQIINEQNIGGLIYYLENISSDKYKIDSILLGCTHFPYLKEEIKKITKLNIIDPADYIISRIQQ